MKINYTIADFDPNMDTLKPGDYVNFIDTHVYKVHTIKAEAGKDVIYFEQYGKLHCFGNKEGVTKINPRNLHKYKIIA